MATPTLFIKEAGQQLGGTPLLLMHGFCETHEIWELVFDQLAQKRHVLAVDLPGFGQSPLPETPFTLDQVAALVMDALRQRGIAFVAPVGHSLGGYVALAMAEAYPEALGGLGLYHSTAYADGEEKKENRNRSVAFVQKYGMPSFLANFVPSLVHGGRKAALAVELENVRKVADTTKVETMVAYTLAMRDRPDRTYVLKDFDGEVLIVGGVSDPFVPLDDTKTQMAMPRLATNHLLEETAHLSMVEWPEQAIDILGAWELPMPPV